MENINEAKNWFFEKINKIGKPLTRLIKKKEWAQINKMRKEKEVITESTDYKRS